MNSYTFRFGTAPGNYPCGNRVTDSIFKRCNVSSIILDNTVNNTDFIQDKKNGILDLSAFNAIGPNSVLTVNFETAI
jgi:hypothetical protein